MRHREETAQQWTSRSLGSRFQHQIFFQLARWRLLRVARVLLKVVVFYYTLLPWVRRRCTAYIQRRFDLPSGSRGWQGFCHAYRLYLEFGQVLLDRMVAAATGEFAVTSETNETRRLLCSILEQGRGCIVMTAHVGAWQMGMVALEVGKTQVNLLQWRDPQDVDRHYFEAGKGRPVKVIDASRPVEAMVEATAVLRRGEVLALMGDRLNPGMDQAHKQARVTVPFLRGAITLPVQPYALASITGAPLVMVLTVRDHGQARPFLARQIAVPQGLNRRDPQVFAPYAGEFAQALEALTTAYPYQFFNFYNLWVDSHADC